MRLFMVVAVLILAMPITGFGWVEGTNILLDPNLMCKKTRRLRGKMAEICRHDSALLREIIGGINLGFRECEFQFRNRRWNCSALRRSMRKILMKDSRESSFVNAITAAGVTYAVTRACTRGALVECSCDRSHSRRNGGQPLMVNAATAVAVLERQQALELEGARARKAHRTRGRGGRDRDRDRDRERDRDRGRDRGDADARSRRQKRKLLRHIRFPEGEWEWGGCSDNVDFGFRNSRAFLDSKHRRRSDLRTLAKLHNNNAGRLAIRDSMRLECKCHGLSGSCTVKTCWLKMPSFREVGARLRDKFDGAFKVAARNDGNSFMAEGANAKRPTRYDLVYADDSPDFCDASARTGSLGTRERECNATSAGVDGCELLCCARGHQRRVVPEWLNCKCVFRWCCEVTCERCLEQREVNTCL